MLHSFVFIAQQYQDAFLILHLLAMVLGLGGATYTDILLVQFLNDLKIDSKEKEVIAHMSFFVTLGVVGALMSGFFLFLGDIDRLLATPKFIAKCIIFVVLLINGFLLHRIVLPRLLHFSFASEHYLIARNIHLRHVGFILGAISAVSWYSLFFLGAISSLSLSLAQILLVYVLCVGLAIFLALLLERYLKKTK